LIGVGIVGGAMGRGGWCGGAGEGMGNEVPKFSEWL